MEPPEGMQHSAGHYLRCVAEETHIRAYVSGLWHIQDGKQFCSRLGFRVLIVQLFVGKLKRFAMLLSATILLSD